VKFAPMSSFIAVYSRSDFVEDSPVDLSTSTVVLILMAEKKRKKLIKGHKCKEIAS